MPKKLISKLETTTINALLIIIIIQVVVCGFTLLYGVPIWLGVIHQLGAFILLGTTVLCLFLFKKKPHNKPLVKNIDYLHKW